MNYKNIVELIKKFKLPNCIVILGTEDFLIDESIKYAKKKYLTNYEDMNYIEFESIEDKFDSFNEFVNTMPFMSDKKICVVKDASFLTSTKSLNKKEEDEIIKLIEEDYDLCIVIFVVKGSKLDSRKKIVKKLKEKNFIFEINKFNELELSKYIKSKFNERNLEINLSDADYIANNSGYLEYESLITLYEINNEINKLSSYCAGKNEIKRDDIDNIMVKSIESNIFKLVDYICEKNKNQAFEMMQEMILNNIQESFIIHMIIRQYRMMYQYILLSNKKYTQDEIMSNMKIKKFVLTKLIKLCRNLKAEDIQKYMDKFLEIDKKIKTGEIDKRVGLEIITNGTIGI